MRRISVGLLALLLCLLSQPIGKTAISSYLVFDIRTTGTTTNGGCYDATITSAGTDFSQQNAAQIAFTDLVIGGTTTQLTSVLNPFTSAMVANCVRITGGIGFTTGIYVINSVSGITATMDRSVGTGASIGGTGNLGGALSAFTALPDANSPFSGTLNVALKSGTYTFTSSYNPAGGGFGGTVNVTGFGTTHGDFGTAPLITTATNSTPLFIWNGGGGTFVNVSFSNTAAARSVGLDLNGGNEAIACARCTFDGFTNAMGGAQPGGMQLVDSEIKNSTQDGLSNPGSYTFISRSSIHNSTLAGVVIGSNGGQLVVIGSLIYANAANGINLNSNTGYTVVLENNDIANNTGAGLIGGSYSFLRLSMQNNIFYGNSTWGLNLVQNLTVLSDRTNAFGQNTSGNLTIGAPQLYTLSSTDITGLSNCFVSSTNFALSTGCVSLKGAGYPGVFPGGSTTGAIDIGAVQTVATTIGTGTYSQQQH